MTKLRTAFTTLLLLSTVMLLVPAAQADITCQNFTGALNLANAQHQSGATYQEAFDALVDAGCRGADISVALCRYYTSHCYPFPVDSWLVHSLFATVPVVPVTKYETMAVYALYEAGEQVSAVTGPNCQDVFGVQSLARMFIEGGGDPADLVDYLKSHDCSDYLIQFVICTYVYTGDLCTL